MKTVRETGLLFNRQALMMLRNPVWMFVGLSSPLLYLVLFTPLLKEVPGYAGQGTGHVLDAFLPGIMSLLAFASGTSAGFGIIFELQSGVTERFRVTPASRLAILLGPILSGSPRRSCSTPSLWWSGWPSGLMSMSPVSPSWRCFSGCS